MVIITDSDVPLWRNPRFGGPHLEKEHLGTVTLVVPEWVSNSKELVAAHELKQFLPNIDNFLLIRENQLKNIVCFGRFCNNQHGQYLCLVLIDSFEDQLEKQVPQGSFSSVGALKDDAPSRKSDRCNGPENSLSGPPRGVFNHREGLCHPINGEFYFFLRNSHRVTTTVSSIRTKVWPWLKIPKG